MVVNMSEVTQNKTLAAPADKTAEDRFTRAKQSRDAAIARRDADRKSGVERERTPDLGGPALKLAVVGEIPGYHMYWENDEDGKIEDLIYQGFDFVARDEVRRGSDLVADMDLSDRISRYVGRREDGSPLRAYLMKCPNQLWDERQERQQRQVNDWDEQIRNGRMKAKADEGQYQPKGYESRLQTNSKV